MLLGATLSCLFACVPVLDEEGTDEAREWSASAAVMPGPELEPRDFPDTWWQPADDLDWPGRGGVACADMESDPDWRDCRTCFMLSTLPDDDGELPILLLGFEVDPEGHVVAQGDPHHEGLVWWYEGPYHPEIEYRTNRWGDWTVKQIASGFLVYQDVGEDGPVWEVVDCER